MKESNRLTCAEALARFEKTFLAIPEERRKAMMKTMMKTMFLGGEVRNSVFSSQKIEGNN